jgi:citrate lyase beta subunit
LIPEGKSSNKKRETLKLKSRKFEQNSKMKALRFRTRISKAGTIHLPKNSSFIDKEVDVIILPKTRRVRKTFKAKEFIEKWAGFLQPDVKSDSKFDYLMEKYK